MMYETIQLNKEDGGGDFGVFVADIREWEALPSGGSVVYFRDNRPPVRVSETVTAIQAAIDTARLSTATFFQLTDGVTAPATGTGTARIYVDASDGDLKVKFGDGTTKVIVSDT